MDTFSPRPRTSRWLQLAGLAAAAVFAALVTWSFHARLLWPPDDGAYAHVAQRMLAGEVLHRDVQDVHTGYINFANAAALWLFGDDLLSLRYPLVAIGVASACLAYLMLLPRGAALALAGSACVSTLTVVQFVNPTAHWYCLLLLLATVATLMWLPRGSRYRLEIVGFLTFAIFLFRQLSGVLAGIGVIAYLLAEAPRDAKGSQTIAARALALVMTAGMMSYLITKTDPAAFILYGVWPVAILVWTIVNATVSNRIVLVILGRLALGAAVSAAPLLAYHLANGSTSAWLDDAFVRAEALTHLGFIHSTSFASMLAASAVQLTSSESVVSAANSGYWMAALLASTLLGWIVVRLIGRYASSSAVHPLPFLAVFYAVVSLHFQIAIYLYYTLSVSILALLWIAGAATPLRRRAAVFAAGAIACIGLYFHAGQPLSRGFVGIINGKRVEVAPCEGVARCSLWMEPEEARNYQHLVGLIEQHAKADETILALPVNPELYFLSGRRNPCRFFNSALGVASAEELRLVVDEIERRPPRLVFHRPDDKYNTRFSAALLAHLKGDYERIDSFAGFDVYLRRTDREGSGVRNAQALDRAATAPAKPIAPIAPVRASGGDVAPRRANPSDVTTAARDA